MPLYRKRAVVIHAFQLKKEIYDNTLEWPRWLWDARNKNPSEEGAIYKDNVELIINTKEGAMKISVDDYVIKGIHDELYPCKPDIFEKTYEYVMSD